MVLGLRIDNFELDVENGWATLPSSLVASGSKTPRFYLTFPAYLAPDDGAHYLVHNELTRGYELPTRNLFEKVLRRGDVFIDVGAHWGYFTFLAATHPAGNVRVIAFEPDPTNASIVFRNIQRNGLAEKVSLVAAACGDKSELTPLVSNSTMGHSIRGIGLKPPFLQGLAKFVSVVTLDAALTHFPFAADARLIVKVDSEGFEPQVIAGARSLLASGRVALLVWECGNAFAEGAERDAMLRMVKDLEDCGFRHLRPPGQEVDGPLAAFDVRLPYSGNVFSLHKSLNL